MKIRRVKQMIAAMLVAVLALQNIPVSAQEVNETVPAAQNEAVPLADIPQEATGVNVAYHSQEEIRNFVKSSGAKVTDAVTYQEAPLTEAPYSLGKLSEETLQSAINMLNQIRYIAGIPYNVVLDDSYNEMAQAASLVNYVNNKMTHYPVKPEGMAEELYELGRTGAGSSNIAWGSGTSWKLNYFITMMWMEDGDASNIDRVGHRRWLLNPSMQKTGFGLVKGSKGTHGAVYAFDGSFGRAVEYGVMWPAQNMPVQYFNEAFPWSISMGESVDVSQVHVVLTRNSDGKVWNFSQASADGAFYVDNNNYGQKGCIIFRPDGVKGYKAGESYHVSITTGLSTGDVSYTVNFFDLDETENSDTAGGGAADEDTSGDNTTGDNTTGGDTSGDNTTGGDTSGDNTTGGDTSGDNTTGGDTSGDNTTGGDTSGDNTTGGDTSGDNTTGGDTSGDNTAGGNTTGGDTSGDNTTGDNTTGGGTSGDNTAGGDTGDTDGSSIVEKTEIRRDGTKIESKIETRPDGKTVITVVTTKSGKRTSYTATGSTADLVAGSKVKLMRFDSKSGEYVLYDSKSYYVSGPGELNLPDKLEGDFILLNTKDAKAASDAILKTIKVKKSTAKVKRGKTVKVAMSSKLNMENVAKITYTVSNPSIASVNKNGRVKAKKKGSVAVKAKVTLKNGKSKTVKMTVKIK